MKGIIEICELVADQMNNDDNFLFPGSKYNGPPILRAEFTGFSRTGRLKTDQHPHMLRKLVSMVYLRHRDVDEPIEYRNFLLAVEQKLLTKPVFREKIIDQILFVDDEGDPQFREGMALSQPILGIHDSDFPTRMRTGGQREEWISVELWLYYQRTSGSAALTITGD